MDSKTVAGLGLAALAVAFFAGGIVEHERMVKEIKQAKPDTVTTHDTVTIKLEKTIYRNLPGKLDTVFASFQGGDITAETDTVMPPHSDTLKVAYHLPPVNSFDIDFRPASRKVESVREVITRTVVDRSFFMGPYFRAGMKSPWWDGVFSMPKMSFEFGVGFSARIDKTALELEPLSLEVLDSKVSFGFEVGAKYYPWAN